MLISTRTELLGQLYQLISRTIALWGISRKHSFLGYYRFALAQLVSGACLGVKTWKDN